MATSAILLKLNKVTTAAMNALATPLDGEPCFNTTTSTIWVYSGGVWVNSAATGTTEVNEYQDLGTITTAGTSTITLGTLALQKEVDVVLGGGAGIYTRIIAVSTTNATAGDVCVINAELPASGNPTLEIRNATGAGTLLSTINNLDAVAAQYWTGIYYYTGAAWKLRKSAYQAD